jgi:hypothetical protein
MIFGTIVGTNFSPLHDELVKHLSVVFVLIFLYNLYFVYIDVDSEKETVSKAANELGKTVEENKSNMVSIVSQLVDKLTGKDLAITYEFDNLQIDIPKATGPDGKEIGSAEWKVSGKIVISSELHDKRKSME